MLVWALNIHKSQGMALQYVDISKKDLLDPGQLYVGLSRATHLEGLQVNGDVREQLEIDSDVLELYENTNWEILPSAAASTPLEPDASRTGEI
jgi:ATP-dependent exoDNAse (exonuclease V) alpha subunit